MRKLVSKRSPHRPQCTSYRCTQCTFLALICVLLIFIDSVTYAYAKISIIVMFDCIIFESRNGNLYK